MRKEGGQSKKRMHERNRHNGSYDFEVLKTFVPSLSSFIVKNPNGIETIDFSDPKAVILLNKALLLSTYQMTYWELPKDNLCPPIPGRADHIHYIADLLAESNKGIIPLDFSVRILDIGVGANVIYPIIGVAEYGWQFVGSEVNVASLDSALKIIENNPHLLANVSLRFQQKRENVLKNILLPEEKFNAVMCNPPFFKSQEDAFKQTSRKLKNLGKSASKNPIHNFGGLSNELWYEGGEMGFISTFIKESVLFKNQVDWFTCLVSNQENLSPLKRMLRKSGFSKIKIIDMAQGNKISRILAWQF